MKKLLFILLVLLIPFRVMAAETTDKFYVNADILENGDVKVQTIIVVKGPFNGYETILSYKNGKDSAIYDASGMSDLKIGAAIYKGQDINFSNLSNLNLNWFSKSSYAYTGNSGIYTNNENSNYNTVRIYYPIEDERAIFYMSYTLKDVIVLHDDVAEFYWNFLTEDFRENIKDVNITINLPKIDNSDYFRVWAHGDLNGEIWPIKDNSGAVATVSNFMAGKSVSVRLVFDKSLINESQILKKSKQAGFDNILEIEEERAEIANKERILARILYYGFLGVNLVFIQAIIIMWIYIYIKYDKEHASNFKSKYYREFIEDYDVEVIDYLMNKNITENAMSASIMNLIYKKKILPIALDSKNKDFGFSLLSKENISSNEEYLINFLFETVGSGKTFTTKELRKYAESQKTYSKFTVSYTTWKNKVKNEGMKQNFYESTEKAIIFGLLALVFSILLIFINSWLNIGNYVCYLSLGLGIIFFIYTLVFNKRTVKGNEHYLKWNAFKNFLNDFGTFDQKELPEIILWERYLVYAVIFGIADKVQKVMNVKIKEYNLENNTTLDHDFWINYHMHTHLSRTINNSVAGSIHAAQSAAVKAASTSSSGSGSGGGFSSGGGGGGGGFGGGRF